EHDDRPPVLHDQSGDVFRGETFHDRGGRGDLRSRDLQHLGDGVHDHAELAALPLEDHRARFLAERRGHAQPLAEIHQRHRDALGSDSPRGTGSAASRTTSSASSTSNATYRVPSPAPSVTRTVARPRSGGGVRSPNRAPRCTTGTSRPRSGVSPRIARRARGTSSTSARSPTSSTRASGSPQAVPSTRTRRSPRLTLPSRPPPRSS